MNMVGNTTETVGSGVSSATMNIMNFAQKPSATNLVRQGTGLVYINSQTNHQQNTILTAANIASQTHRVANWTQYLVSQQDLCVAKQASKH